MKTKSIDWQERQFTAEEASFHWHELQFSGQLLHELSEK
jgi:hypothetical protein